jgi:PhnB protein
MAFGPHPPPIQAHICVKGGVNAIEFYKKAFDAKCPFHQLTDDGKRVMHANIELFGGEVMLHDEFPEYGGEVLSPLTRGGVSVTININLPKAADVDAAIARAAAAGAEVVSKPEDAFWGARYGRVRDPFGHVWAFNAPLQGASA